MAAVGALKVESTAAGYCRGCISVGRSRQWRPTRRPPVSTPAICTSTRTPPTAMRTVMRRGQRRLRYRKIEAHQTPRNYTKLGIVVHLVIIGIGLGTFESLDTIRPLMVALMALCFHQLIEGMGLGGCLGQAKFKCKKILTMALFFGLTMPLGVAVGIGIQNSYDENSPKSLAVQGILDAAASGILIYMALVDLLAADFMSPRVQNSLRLRLGSDISLLLGAGCMSIVAKWA